MKTNDLKLQQMYIRKNLSENRKTQYNRVFQRIQTIAGYTPTQLLNLAREEQKPRMADGQIEFKEIEDRTITQVQYQLYNHLVQNGLKLSTIKSELGIYRAFLREYNIQLPKNINIRLNQPLYEEGDLPQKQHILQAIQSTSNKRNKALFYFMSSSGIRPVDVRNLKIKDWIKACNYYTENDDITIQELLDLEYDNFIPCFYFRPQKTSSFNNVCCTFCTPESTVAVMEYLKTRHIRSNEEYLFSSRGSDGGQLAQTSFRTLFQRLNDREFGVNKFGERFFQAKYLRKFFISTCNSHSGDLLKVRLLAGHTLTDIDRAYNEINLNVMRRFYLKLVPYLSLNDTSVKTVKSKEYSDLERKLKKQELENRKLQEEIDDRIDIAIRNVLERYK